LPGENYQYTIETPREDLGYCPRGKAEFLEGNRWKMAGLMFHQGGANEEIQ